MDVVPPPEKVHKIIKWPRILRVALSFSLAPEYVPSSFSHVYGDLQRRSENEETDQFC